MGSLAPRLVRSRFPVQGLKPHTAHCKADFQPLDHQGSPPSDHSNENVGKIKDEDVIRTPRSTILDVPSPLGHLALLSQPTEVSPSPPTLYPLNPPYLAVDIVNKAEIDVVLELSCFFYDPADVGNLISGPSAFS